MNNSEESHSKSITLNLKYFLEHHCLKEQDSIPVPLLTAQLISAIDSDEQFVHVQFTALSQLNNYDCKNPPSSAQLVGEPLNNPIVWWKSAWEIYYPRIVRDKINSFNERKKNNVNSENIERIARKLRAMTRLPIESTRMMAVEMWKNPDKEFLRGMGIHIEEIK